MSLKVTTVNSKELTFPKKKTRFCKRPGSVKPFFKKDDKFRIPLAYAIEKGNKVKKLDYKKIKVKSVVKLKESQIDPYNACIENLGKYHTYFLQVPCGSGKTVMATHSISLIKLLTLIVVPDYNLMRQWLQALVQFLPKVKIFVMGKTKSYVLKEMLPENKKNVVDSFDEADVLISLPTAVSKLSKKETNQIGYVICDEAKLLCTQKIVCAIMNTTPKYLLGLSADYEKPDNTHLMMDVLYGKRRFKIESVKPFIVHKINTPFKPDVEDTSDWTAVIKSISMNEERNLAILKNILNNTSEGDKVLVMCRRTFHVEILEKLLATLKKTETLYKDKKGYKNCQLLIVSIKKGGVGFDGKNSCVDEYDGIPFNKMHIVSPVKEGILQIAGRVGRAEEPEIFHYVDDMSTLRTHWIECEKWYKSVKGEIRETYLKMKI